MAITIGDLRWPVTLFVRTQVPDPSGPGTVNVDTPVASMRASIEAIRPSIFWSTTVESSNDMPSHSVVIRGNYYLSSFHYFQRIRRFSDGVTRCETFRVARVSEMDGGNQWIKAECHLDRVDVLP